MVSTIKYYFLFVFVLLEYALGENERCPEAVTNYSIFDVDIIRNCNKNFLQFQFKIADHAFPLGKYTLAVDTVDFSCLPGYAQTADFTQTVHLNTSTPNLVIPYNTTSAFKLFRNCSYNVCFNDRKRRPLYGLQRRLPDFYFNQPAWKGCDRETCLCDANAVSIDNINTITKRGITELSWNDLDSSYILDVSYLHECYNDYDYQQIQSTVINITIVRYFLGDYIGNQICLTLVFRKHCGCYVFKLVSVNEPYRTNRDFARRAAKGQTIAKDKPDVDEKVNSFSTAKKFVVILSVLLIVCVLLCKFVKSFKRGYGISIEKIEKCPRTTLRKTEIAALVKNNNADPYEISKSNIELSNEIGKGAFGHVFLARALIYGTRMQVAVKTMRDRATPEELDDFLSEIDVMKKIGQHCNVVRMYKCCTVSQPYMMVMEYIPFGDLKNYLLDLRSEWNKDRHPSVDSCFSDAYIVPESPNNNTILAENTEINIDLEYSTEELLCHDLQRILDHRELQNFALQIAKGMTHLEKHGVIHRDLAARNILINEKKILKISDFGLSRSGPYMANNFKKVPLRWLALEAIEDHFYDSKSDVWSFAVVLWEIGTLGGFPYEQIADNMLVYHIQNGTRLQRPAICTDELYQLMLRCWSKEASQRPSFEELIGLLDVKTRRIYIDFSQLNPSYVFPPAEEQAK